MNKRNRERQELVDKLNAQGYFNAAQTARKLAVNPTTLNTWRRKALIIPAKYLGNGIGHFYTQEEIDRYLAEMNQGK